MASCCCGCCYSLCWTWQKSRREERTRRLEFIQTLFFHVCACVRLASRRRSWTDNQTDFIQSSTDFHWIISWKMIRVFTSAWRRQQETQSYDKAWRESFLISILHSGGGSELSSRFVQCFQRCSDLWKTNFIIKKFLNASTSIKAKSGVHLTWVNIKVWTEKNKLLFAWQPQSSLSLNKNPAISFRFFPPHFMTSFYLARRSNERVIFFPRNDNRSELHAYVSIGEAA